MKGLFTKIASSLLIFSGTVAIYAGWQLITNPDGGSLNLSLDYIKHAPFHDYLVPGILLIILNGLFSIFTLICTLVNHKSYSLLIIMQGAILTIWMVIKVLMVRDINIIDCLFGLTGQMLIICGWILAKINDYFVIK